MMRTKAIAALRQLSGGYIRDRRASGELRSRIVAMAHERSRLVQGVELHQQTERTQRRLAEVEKVRLALERSARAADDRLRGVEAVIAAVVTEAAALPADTTPQADPARPARRPTRVDPAPSRPADTRGMGTQAPVRGGWSRPGSDD